MHVVEKSLQVEVPIHRAYAHWADFEAFPQFMEGIESVNRIDDRRWRWRASLYGKTQEWDAEVTEMSPNQRIAWQSISGPSNSGVVTFDPTGLNRTRVTVRITYEPSGILERAGDILGLVDRKVEGDLQRFKDFVETVETGVGTPPTSGAF